VLGRAGVDRRAQFRRWIVRLYLVNGRKVAECEIVGLVLALCIAVGFALFALVLWERCGSRTGVLSR
jgi:hypothetical protein